ncbi:MAG: hypothetical protein ACC642_11665, partial [Pseudomonadales bacterium]
MQYPDSDHLLEEAIAAWQAGDSEAIEQTIDLVRDWLSQADTVRLPVTYHCAGGSNAPAVMASVEGATFSLDDPVLLVPVHIDKPWGQEIWFTGIEARGESRVRTDNGTLGLASYLAAAPTRLCDRQPIVLLKILDPKPEPLLGELYFEVHAEKREVYVVTEVDERAWPEGAGRIRFGMNQTRRAEFADDESFRRAFLESIERYEAIRQSIDSGETGLEAAERDAREQTVAFTDYRALRTGDVVTVPAWVPHSLQHGVQVVEFQTPSYERHIISFAQQVTTQDHWDSATAIARMHLDAPLESDPESIAPGIEKIVNFPEFGVWRVALSPGKSLQLPGHIPYAVAICIRGTLSITGRSRSLELQRHQAAFIPASAISSVSTNHADETGL